MDKPMMVISKTMTKNKSAVAPKKNWNWISKAIGKKGNLHRALKVPMGQKIPLALLKKASKRNDKVGREARLALTLRSFRKV